MAVNWERRRRDAEAPEYLPNADLFTIKLHYEKGGEQGFVGFIDFCCADQISKIELLNMAREFHIDVAGCTLWWLDLRSECKGLREIVNDLDALDMANNVSSSREVYVSVRIANGRFIDGSGVRVAKMVVSEAQMDVDEGNDDADDTEDADDDINEVDSDFDLENELLGFGRKKQNNEEEEEGNFYDSDYSFTSDSDGETMDITNNARAVAIVTGEPSTHGKEQVSDSDFDQRGSEELNSCSSTDEEGIKGTRPKYSEFNEDCDMKNPKFKIGMKFRSFKQFKEAVRNYGIRNRYVMNFRPNSQKRCKAFCKKKCLFYLWASPMVKDSNTVQIKSGHLTHECSREHNNRHVNAEWIAKTYLEQFRADPTWKISGIIQAVKTKQEVEISRNKAYRAKCYAIKLIDGDEHTQMTSLYDYRLELLETHPGSTIQFKCDAGQFQAMYVCLSPLREGFLAGCRRVVSVDGCFLKGMYGGQLLTTVGIDGNDCTYPIAWATVRKENKEYWRWFLQHLAEDLHIHNDNSQWAFMSDRQKGLLPAIEELFPSCEHRFCVRHIHTNFRAKFRGKALKDQVWACATATSIPAFERSMNTLKNMSLGAFHYMKNIPAKHWSRSHFQEQFKCSILLNNMCESFNAHILEARTKGIITMNEMLRTQLMVRIQKRRDSMRKITSMHCPKIVKKLEKLKQSSFLYSTVWSGGYQYQVLGPDGQFVVDKDKAMCSCRTWQLTGVPCSHVISVIYYNNDRPENYLNDCYKVSTYLETYRHTLNPTHDKEFWPKSHLEPMIPPAPVTKTRGRKTMLRRREVDEGQMGFTHAKVSKKGMSIKCSICGAKGHNKRFHGGSQGMKQHQSQPGETSQENHVNHIDAQVSSIGRSTQHELAPTQTLASGFERPISQVINPSVEAHPIETQPTTEAVVRKQKLNLVGGKGCSTLKAQQHGKRNFSTTAKLINPLKPQLQEKEVEQRHKEQEPVKKKRAWIPPGVTPNAGSGATGRAP